MCKLYLTEAIRYDKSYNDFIVFVSDPILANSLQEAQIIASERQVNIIGVHKETLE